MSLKNKTIIIIIAIIICILSVLLVITRTTKISRLVNLNPSKYLSITINDDKKIEAVTHRQYLIDDFIPKLDRYRLREYSGRLPKKYSYRIEIKGKDGKNIKLYDNDVIIVNGKQYEIVSGMIDLNSFDKMVD